MMRRGIIATRPAGVSTDCISEIQSECEQRYLGKLHFFLEILAFFQKVIKLFGKMARFSPFFGKAISPNS